MNIRRCIKTIIPFTVIFVLSISVNAQEYLDALRMGDLSTVKMLIKKNPELVNKKQLYGLTPLNIALMFEHRKITEYLIEKGADVNSRVSFEGIL